MKNLPKITSVLAILVGLMSVFAGSRVLLGVDIKTYNILNWLVVYNVVYGFVSILVSYFIYTKNSIAKQAIIFVLSSHVIVLSYIYFFSNTVPSESIKAMVFRVSVWILILLLFSSTSINSQKKI